MQKIVYAKKTSDIFAKLRGTYSAPATAHIASGGGGGISTDLQKSIFGAPPGTATLPNRPGEKAAEAAPAQGVKRPREGESDEEEAPMDEEDSDVPMEASSSDEE